MGWCQCPVCWGKEGMLLWTIWGDAEGLFCYSGAIYWSKPTGRSVAGGMEHGWLGWSGQHAPRSRDCIPSLQVQLMLHCPSSPSLLFPRLTAKKHQNLKLGPLSQLLQLWFYQESEGDCVKVAVGGSAAPATVHLQQCPRSISAEIFLCFVRAAV